ncbi:Uncharacterized protein BM_BM17397 [Brugia malayi]|uniref:Uncharacterized protein n=1 Tax=Brugia malayi TaxID=6279 RepID=A0A4E9FB60_BRUMA|nr:Uncharacterized protein BM_BM17397 [Brugia malayi]VIO91938.1 Uncharacterized protein BM_BM17397 [Brugia malayi]
MNDNLDDNKESVDNVVVDVVVVGAGVVVVDVVVVVGAVDDDVGVGDDIAAVELMQILKLVAIKYKEKVQKRMRGGE